MTELLIKIKGCVVCDGVKLTSSDSLKINILDEYVTSGFPDVIIARVVSITEETIGGADGLHVTVSYDETLLPTLLNICHFDGVPECYTCCEKLGDKLDNLSSDDIVDFNAAVIAALDTNADGVFTAEDIAGIADFISAQIASGDITISASDVTGFCAEVASCLSTDAGVQAALANLLANNPTVNNALDDVIADAIENDADVVQALADSIANNTVVQDAINGVLDGALSGNTALQAAVLAILDPNSDGVMDALTVDASDVNGLLAFITANTSDDQTSSEVDLDAPIDVYGTNTTNVDEAITELASLQSGDGWRENHDGKLTMWGQISANANSTATVIFPVTLLDNTYKISLSTFSTGESSAETFTLPTNIGFGVKNWTSSVKTIHWIIEGGSI